MLICYLCPCSGPLSGSNKQSCHLKSSALVSSKLTKYLRFKSLYQANNTRKEMWIFLTNYSKCVVQKFVIHPCHFFSLTYLLILHETSRKIWEIWWYCLQNLSFGDIINLVLDMVLKMNHIAWLRLTVYYQQFDVHTW